MKLGHDDDIGTLLLSYVMGMYLLSITMPISYFLISFVP